jgi:UDP-N-acetylglucosamine--N-acetylmuramyl-(pentapeptide) pyrophosphoryl-undecaprenol N-acetylglucosamine transferase
MSAPVIVTAGGTGGHMFPALALARELQARGRRVVFLTDARGARYLAAEDEAHLVAAGSPSGSLARRVRAVLALGQGLAQSIALLVRLRPEALAAFGGYASVPAALAARLTRVPLLVHEQNAVLGRANRLIARGAARIALSFADTRKAASLPAGRVLVTGNPVRPAFLAVDAPSYVAPRSDGPLRLLVLGGSQGARAFSTVLPPALAALPGELRARLDLVQQCRPEDLGQVERAYREAGIRAELAAFFDDVPARMARAHLVVSRAGASTVAELQAAGLPSLLVPYRHAADDHQRANAELLAAAGAAWMMLEDDLSAEGLAARLAVLLAGPDQLAGMADRARALARPDAASRLADAVLALAAAEPVAGVQGGPVL